MSSETTREHARCGCGGDVVGGSTLAGGHFIRCLDCGVETVQRQRTHADAWAVWKEALRLDVLSPPPIPRPDELPALLAAIERETVEAWKASRRWPAEDAERERRQWGMLHLRAAVVRWLGICYNLHPHEVLAQLQALQAERDATKKAEAGEGEE